MTKKYEFYKRLRELFNGFHRHIVGVKESRSLESIKEGCSD